MTMPQMQRLVNERMIKVPAIVSLFHLLLLLLLLLLFLINFFSNTTATVALNAIVNYLLQERCLIILKKIKANHH